MADICVAQRHADLGDRVTSLLEQVPGRIHSCFLQVGEYRGFKYLLKPFFQLGLIDATPPG